MKISAETELPPELHQDYRKAVFYVWLTIAYQLVTIILFYMVLGSSQAMKAAWIEDIISLAPPIAILIALRLRNKAPNKHFPYGYHQAVTIAYLCAAVSVLAVGGYLFIDSALKLISAEHPTIGTVTWFGDPMWLGWPMLTVLFISAVPAMIIGRVKLPLAERLHDKPIYADALMNKAQWMTGLAGMAGVAGIGYGYWWADSVAAIIIALDIMKDGLTNTRASVSDLMFSMPKTVGRDEYDPLPDRIVHALKQKDWVKEAEVRLREHGQVFFGEIYLVPVDEQQPFERTNAALECVHEMDWRIQEVTIQLVRKSENINTK